MIYTLKLKIFLFINYLIYFIPIKIRLISLRFYLNIFHLCYLFRIALFLILILKLIVIKI
jgi:hypothetical protein